VIGYEDIEYASQTDVGVRRSHNQDAYAAMPASDPEQWRGRGHVFLVADGMGAHAVGELASKLAADSIPHIYSKHSREGPVSALRKAFIETNLSIHTRGQQNREFEGMGTTATAVLLRPEGAWIGHVGDSRAYRVREGRIEQLSFDHSLIWELARRQRKDPSELQGIPSNVIVRSLGPEPLVQVDVEGPHPVRPGDYFVLCSDGLSGPVSDREIGAIVSALPPAEACRFLVHLANLQGGPDNITAIVVRVGKPEAGLESVNGKKPPQVQRDVSKPPLAEALGHKLKRVWPFALLFLGIALSSLAITLTFHELPDLGKVPFLLATAALIAGLVGLIVQTRQEKARNPLETYIPRTKIYRQTPCPIDHGLVERMAHAVTELDERVREKNWQADWDKCKAERELAEENRERGDYLEAFRGFCRAMMTLMNAVQQQRAKEEMFRPLWDTPERRAE
jgi:serine/threonine protein phosphatase PrpC